MCEIFPEVGSFCGLCGYRIGLLIIAILTIMTGVVSMAGLNYRAQVNYVTIKAENKPQFGTVKSSLSSLTRLIPALMAACSMAFIIAGLILFCSTISDSEGMAQVFLWIAFLDLLAVFILFLLIGYQCIATPVCFLGDSDWLTLTCGCLFVFTYLLLWIYFLAVASSYVLNGDKDWRTTY